jgi:hypothetical protein
MEWLWVMRRSSIPFVQYFVLNTERADIDQSAPGYTEKEQQTGYEAVPHGC